ncbi:hepatic lectin-like [Cheilinus undulatus]|uniref:hepatic lectin-like n=1 Tax=Cheilinus undulatus TaxID=241271 RepID=UPI001BD55049|nr:hepatic lectin-like [Cheilinus undulatus]
MESDTSALWTKDRVPLPLSVVTFGRRWLFPALTATFILILIIVLGVTNTKTSSRLSSMETSVSNLSGIIKSMNTSLQQAQERAKEVEKMRFAVENNKDQLNSVSEAMKQLAMVDYLSRTVSTLKCSLERIISNRSGGEAACCPAGWDQFDNNCYFFSATSKPWNESKAECEKLEAHLLILHSDKAWDFVTKHSVPVWYWVGLSKLRTGRWEWVSQTPYTMEPSRWMPGQPYSSNGRDWSCAHLHTSGRLNVQYCPTKMRFICQKRSVRN